MHPGGGRKRQARRVLTASVRQTCGHGSVELWPAQLLQGAWWLAPGTEGGFLASANAASVFVACADPDATEFSNNAITSSVAPDFPCFPECLATSRMGRHAPKSMVTQTNTSGYYDDMLEDEAKKMYAARFEKEFQLVHWWKILKDEPKWNAQFIDTEKEKDKNETLDVPQEKTRPIG